MKTKTIFRGDPALKEEAIERAIEHREADHLYHGVYADIAVKDRGDVDRRQVFRSKDRYVRVLDKYEPERLQFVGCAVGCLATPANGRPLPERIKWGLFKRLWQNPHQALETELGIPRRLGRLADGIFEGHGPNSGYAIGPAAMWPERFVRMLPVGLEMTSELTADLDEMLCLNIGSDPEDEYVDITVEGAKRRLKAIIDRHAKAQGL